LPAAVGDLGGKAANCSIALHSDGDRPAWTAEYVKVVVRCLTIAALNEMELLSRLVVDDDTPMVYFDSEGGRWPFADALGTVAVDEYAAFLGVLGLEGLRSLYGVDPAEYNGGAEDREAGGVGPAIDTMTGAPIAEVSADSGGAAAVLALGDWAPPGTLPPRRGAAAAAAAGPFDGLLGLPGGRRPTARAAGRTAQEAAPKGKPSLGVLADQMQVLMARLAFLETGHPGPSAAAPAAAGFRGPAFGVAPAASYGVGSYTAGRPGGQSGAAPGLGGRAYPGAIPKAVTFREPPGRAGAAPVAGRNSSFVPAAGRSATEPALSLQVSRCCAAALSAAVAVSCLRLGPAALPLPPPPTTSTKNRPQARSLPAPAADSNRR
jgi:hypothetical protein